MGLNNDLAIIKANIPVIKDDRNYWFVRTTGGQYYESFIEGSYIAIGFDEIQFSDIKLGESLDRVGIDLLNARIKKVYPREKRPGIISSPILRFAYKIKKSDIVIIPSENSEYLHFGEVQSSIMFQKDNRDKCPYLKRKNVKWLKKIKKSELDPAFYKLVFTHNIVSNVNAYEVFIDRAINSLFTKRGVTHLLVPVRTNEAISTDSFYKFGDIFKLVNDVSEDVEWNKTDDFKIKSRVESPGFIEISTISVLGIIALGLIINAIAGGGFSFGASHEKGSTKINADIKSDGIIEKVRQALQSKRNSKLKADIVKKAIVDMKITTPDELSKILDKLD